LIHGTKRAQLVTLDSRHRISRGAAPLVQPPSDICTVADSDSQPHIFALAELRPHTSTAAASAEAPCAVATNTVLLDPQKRTHLPTA
jgi:hypothetical protein